MALFKSAQLTDMQYLEAPVDEVIIYQEKPHSEDLVEVEQELEPEFSFKLPPLPGIELEVEEEEPVVEEKKEDKAVSSGPKDMWDRSNHPDLLMWAQELCHKIPSSNGKVGGIEREIACYKKLRNELSKAMSEDYHGKINVDQFEVAVERIEERIDQLEDLHSKLTGKGKKKKAEDESGLIKEARTPHFGGWVMTVSPLLMRCAQVCVNGTVSGGKDIENLFNEQVEKYSLDKRERAELLQVLDNMGYPLKTDRLMLDDELIQVSSPGELNSNYFA